MNYEEDIRIDENALDIEWLQQPKLMFRYAQLAASAKQEVDTASERLALVRAQLDKTIRTDPESFEIAKVTETAISNAILMDGKHQSANEELIKARYDYEVAKAAVSAFDQKKTALENLVRLHGMQYFAGPKVPRDISYEWQQKESQKSADKKIIMRRK